VTVLSGTVRSWNAGTRAGDVLLDDGTTLAFSGEAVQVRGLRLGQRVRLRVEGTDVAAVTIATLPFT
jgi:hypothetical protein